MSGRCRGFTLIELMIVVVVVAILSALAFPSYVEAVRKSRRAEAKTALLELAARQERYFTTHNAYAETPPFLGYAGSEFPVEVRFGTTAYYRLHLELTSDASGWRAVAEPTPAQDADACGSYTIDHLGIQGVTGGRLPVDACW
ncbi:type IV pilin protein [Schlegelella sp. S2-27]|uniref:Type IV pilin protein n=2 Tax=Caldimonas mangrovi TaxID=2944811 RepID=A0ABT0YRZ0_9BURK|nr:type IV pilin protein [Caldimonas mangrovi]